jgi:hypothetical protein
MTELLDAVASWPSLVLVVVVFGFAPGFCLRLIILTYPRRDPRRKELIAELYAVPRIQRPFWVAEQLEVALFEGLGHRISAARASKGDVRRADAEQLAQRFTTAVDKLVHEKTAVRLAGVNALAQLADDWGEQRQVCIDVLCAYQRMTYETDPASDKHREGEREVRHTITRLIRDHLQDNPHGP